MDLGKWKKMFEYYERKWEHLAFYNTEDIQKNISFSRKLLFAFKTSENKYEHMMFFFQNHSKKELFVIHVRPFENQKYYTLHACIFEYDKKEPDHFHQINTRILLKTTLQSLSNEVCNYLKDVSEYRLNYLLENWTSKIFV
jgi:dTDP-4-amino-4,6-dideoxygalactose transaminase